jgi:small subunit ribosomal protein S20
VKSAVSALDRAASKGIIPARRASRVKGRLAAALHKAKAAA